MKDTIINLTPSIGGVQYGISDAKGEHGWNYNFGLSKVDFLEYNYIAHSTEWNCCRKVICSTNPKDTRFPYLIMPSKEQEVESVVSKIDDIAAQLEDTLHGTEGKLISEIRKLLVELK